MKISFVCSRIPVWKYLKVFLLSACLWMKVSVCEGMVPTSVIEDWKVEAALAVMRIPVTCSVLSNAIPSSAEEGINVPFVYSST